MQPRSDGSKVAVAVILRRREKVEPLGKCCGVCDRLGWCWWIQCVCDDKLFDGNGMCLLEMIMRWLSGLGQNEGVVRIFSPDTVDRLCYPRSLDTRRLAPSSVPVTLGGNPKFIIMFIRYFVEFGGMYSAD
jgi:hypothetical protein